MRFEFVRLKREVDKFDLISWMTFKQQTVLVTKLD